MVSLPASTILEGSAGASAASVRGRSRRLAVVVSATTPVLLAALILLVTPWPVGAQGQADTKAVADFVDSTIKRGQGILLDPGYRDGSRREALWKELTGMLRERFDLRLMGALALGKGRKRFSPAELDEFSDLFARLLLNSYIEHVERHADKPVEIVDAISDDPRRVLVKTRLKPRDKYVTIDYAMKRSPDGGWQAYDIKFDGVSLLRNYRAQFRESLEKNTPRELIETVRQKVEENERNR